jgi:hypothetical protein
MQTVLCKFISHHRNMAITRIHSTLSVHQVVNTNDQDTPRLAGQSLDPAGIVENPHPQTVASSLKCHSPTLVLVSYR